ncbi:MULTISPECIES: hypothetical protein [Paenibacillus]|nr:hypothetical protein [Paenibacillus lautus]
MTNQITIKQLSDDKKAILLDTEFARNYPWYTSSDYFLTDWQRIKQETE